MNKKCMVNGFVAIAVVLLVATTGMAQYVISVNFFDPEPAGGIVGNNEAGVVRVGNWTDWNVNVALGGTTAMSALKDDLGNPTTAGGSIEGGVDVYYVTPGMGKPGDNAMIGSHWYNFGGTSTVTLSAIPYAKYDLYVYYNANQPGTIDFTIQGTSLSLTGLDTDTGVEDTAFVIADPGNSIPGNYVVFEDLTASDVTLVATPGTNQYSYINGIQIAASGVLRLTDPFPGDEDEDISPDVNLTWVRPFDAINVTYDIYLQKDDNFVTPVFSGLAGESYNPDPDLDYSTEYFWRVDTHGTGADPDSPDPNHPVYNVPLAITGATWSFTTMDEFILAGDVISVNLKGDGQFVGDQFAGVVPAGKWNDYLSGTISSLQDSGGSFTTTSFKFTTTGVWTAWHNGGAAIPGDPGSNAMLDGHIYDLPGATVQTVTFGGTIPYDQYDLYIYYNSQAIAGNVQTFTIRGTGLSLNGIEGNVAPDTSLRESDGVDGNYVVFRGLTDPNLFIDNSSATGFVYMNGFQIVRIALQPNPVNGAKDVDGTVVLTWTNPFDVQDATYDVYFKKGDPDFGSPMVTGSSEASYDPDPDLDDLSNYFWRVDMHAFGPDPNSPEPNNPIYNVPVSVTGSTWRFTTSGKAKVLDPANGAVGVHPSAILQWIPMAGNKKHDVYFGTDAIEVANADVTDGTGIYQGRQDVTEITFDPYNTAWMDWSETYYWRIDEVIESSTDTIYPGDVWSFSTIVPVCTAPPIGDTNGDCLVTLEDLADIASSWLTCGLEPVESCPF